MSSCEANITREPLTHMMHYLMSLQSDQSGSTCFGASCGKLRDLVYGKMDALMLEFETLLDASHRKWSLLKSLMEKESFESQHRWTSVLVACTLEIASELHRRVVAYVKSYPAKLAWLIFTEPAYNPCQHRRKLAVELLALAPEKIDPSFTGKFRAIFKTELEICAKTGTIDSMVYQLVSDFFSMLPVETQEIEGTNSMIKRIYQLSPNIKLPLMSDRILIKKALTTKVTTGETPMERWQARMDALEFAVESHQHALEQFLLDLLSAILFLLTC